MSSPQDGTSPPNAQQVSNLLIQKQWLLCALYALEEDNQTPVTAETLLTRHAAYGQTVPSAPLSNDLLHEYIDALEEAALITTTDSTPPKYELAIDHETLRTGLKQSTRFQLTKALGSSNLP